MSVGWESQPRDAATGQWILRRGGAKRGRTVKIRLTQAEEATIRTLADASGQTITAYIVGKCCARPAAPAAQPESIFARHRAELVRRNRRRR